MKILSLTTAHPSNDIRISRIHTSYSKVSNALLFSSLSAFPVHTAFYNRTFNNRFIYLCFRVYFLALAIFKLLISRPKIVHVHDPDLYIIAAVASRLRFCRSFIDIHERYDSFFHVFNLRITNFCAKDRNTYFFSAGEDISRYLSSCFAIEAMPLENYPQKHQFGTSYQLSHHLLNEFITSSSTKIVFSAGYSPKRCLSSFLSAIKLLNPCDDVNIIICGSGSEARKPYMYTIADNINVYMFTLLPQLDVEYINSFADISICLFSNEINHQCIRSNRFYEALSYDHHIIVPDFGEWADMALCSNQLYACSPDSPLSICHALEKSLLESKVKSTDNQFSWITQEAKLLNLIGSICQ